MKNISMKLGMVIVAISALGLMAGCGGGGGSTGTSASTDSGAPVGVPPVTPPTDAAALYAANCADCHGTLASSEKTGTTSARLQTAITNNVGGMGFLAGLSAAERQAIVTALTPATTPPPVSTDGTALYAANCAGCHGALANSGKKGTTLARLQSAITGNVGNMGYLSTLTAAQQQAIVTALVTTTTPPPVTSTDGAALYAANCASCHGALASSAKKGATAAQIQVRMDAPPYVSTALTAAQVQAIATVLETPATPPPVTSTDGVALYAANCASCHGPLATSAKKNATVAQIQTRMDAPPYVATALTTAQVQAIATALVSSTTTTPPPAATCGSCHALPPAIGQHSKHASKRVACATCHGTGFSTTTVNAATHNNGVKNLTSTIGWNASSRSCANSCHGTERW